MNYIKKKIINEYEAILLMKKADKISTFKNKLDRNKENILIFQCKQMGAGLFSVVSQVLCYSEWAERNDYKLIVDMKTFKSLNISEDRVGKDNGWEYFFKQPFEDMPTLEVVYTYRSYSTTPEVRRVFLNRSKIIENSFIYKYLYKVKPDFKIMTVRQCLEDENYYRMWCSLLKKRIILNDITKEYVENEYNSILKGKRVLAVCTRGSDYTSHGGAYYHNIQPTLDQLLYKVKEFKTKYNYEYVYYSGEMFAPVKELEKIFPGKVLYNKRRFYDTVDFENSVFYKNMNTRDNDNYLSNLEYLSSIYLVSKCDGIVSSITTGYQIAYILNDGKYSHKYFFDIGYYGIDDVEKAHTIYEQ